MTFLEVPLLCGKKRVQSPPCIKMPAHVPAPPQGLTHGIFWAVFQLLSHNKHHTSSPSLFANHAFLRNTHSLWNNSGQSTNIYFTSKLNVHGTFTHARNFACIVFIKPHKKTPLVGSNFASTLQMMRRKLWNVGQASSPPVTPGMKRKKSVHLGSWIHLSSNHGVICMFKIRNCKS